MMRSRLIALALAIIAAIPAVVSVLVSVVVAVGAPGSQYHRNLLVSHDQDANAMIGGDPDETISSVLAKRTAAGCRPCRWICRLLAMLDNHHCKKSLEPDEGKDAVIP